ncbi:MAG TPA: hypothetical protein VJ400_07875 [Thermoplasmata archaeon]|nr:hypothetical protein [Thermoplasmata archaeon]
MVVTVAMWMILVYKLDPELGADLAPAAGLLAYAIGFFFSAYVGLHIYFFTTSQSQDRQFRQQYITKHVEEIYAPLYDEVAKVVRELEGYEWPRLEVWPAKKGTHYAFFVDDDLRSQLDLLESFLSTELSAAHSDGYDAGGGAAVQALRSMYSSRISDYQVDTVRGLVAQQTGFLQDPSTTRPSKDVSNRVRSVLGNIDGTLLTDEGLERIFSKMKQSFEDLPEAARFRDARKKAHQIAVPLRGALKERVLRPYELR